ncbi:hypothetical protein [Macrococcoides bohemicum]|uniref:hypothetical protein n=1 Tax=Macrococcoides bohemicum TaxID=1903056 RepID=UPI00289F03A9|nr:hypothetical protein [Macrococcus bohemicus]
MKSPRQLLYDTVFERLSMLGFIVYDKLPMEEVPYPFIVIKNNLSEYDKRQKSNRSMALSLKIDTWHLSDNRGEHDKTLTQIEQSLFSLVSIEGLPLIVRDLRTNEMTDTTTKDSLLHGIIDVTYQII